jgi:hypothetical protein
LHENSERVLVKTADGKILTVSDRSLDIKLPSGERKHFEYRDLLVVNEAIRNIFRR